MSLEELAPDSLHSLRPGLGGSLIRFDTLAFMPHRHQTPSRLPSPLEFLTQSIHFTGRASLPSALMSVKNTSYFSNPSNMIDKCESSWNDKRIWIDLLEIWFNSKGIIIQATHALDPLTLKSSNRPCNRDCWHESWPVLRPMVMSYSSH